jgi:3',5'-cyclic AMP phosphodiesterase CpdA
MNRRAFLSHACRLGALAIAGCARDTGLLLPAGLSPDPPPDDAQLLARFAHITDTHLVDEQSPARFPGAHQITEAAWRPYEAYAPQILDGILRTINRLHAAGQQVDFVVHTGDACDNAQANELNWLLQVFDGRTVDPLSGPDDRLPEDRPPATLDPHAPFIPQGLYRNGVHGDQPTIPWFLTIGNHDVHALGVFPTFPSAAGHQTAPLPLPNRPGILLPNELDPLGDESHTHITPAHPGPPALLAFPQPVQPNPQRAFLQRSEYAQQLAQADTPPPGHDPNTVPPAFYTASPTPGLRLVGLDTTDIRDPLPAGLYVEGAISREQLDRLDQALSDATSHGERAIILSHHPSAALSTRAGSHTTPQALRRSLNDRPAVVLHLCGHRHRHRVHDRGGYLEIETCSTLDLPQEARLVELWRSPDGDIAIRYRTISHLTDELPPFDEDPLRPLREAARAVAIADSKQPRRHLRPYPTPAVAAGQPADRAGTRVIAPR